MGPEVIIYTFVLLAVLVILGVHIGVALGVASVIGVWLAYGDLEIALSILGSTSYEAIRSDALAVIPLFVLMGEVLSKAGAATDLYRLCDSGLKRLPGRLAAATVFGNAAFAAVSGVSIASAATFSRIAYPEMRKLGYDQSYALGVVAGSACLGMLIPPSVLLIVWAILTEGSVGALFIAGVGPGILLAFAFVGYNVIAAMRDPSLAPDQSEAEAQLPENKLSRDSLIGGLGVIALILLVLGGIWLGWFTPTEAAGFGAAGGILIGFFKKMTIQDFISAVISAGRTAAPIMFLLIAGSMYARLLAVSGGTGMITDMFNSSGMSPIMIMLAMTVVWLLMGTLIDSISIILLTVPIFFPLAIAAGIPELAFAIYGIMIIEAGLLTPPVGLLIYTVKAAVPDKTVTLTHAFKGAIPYWMLILGVAVLILIFPAIATWLPAKTF
ncbi:MAG: TRAP transporter large permease [Hyphomonadaceae bacterium]